MANERIESNGLNQGEMTGTPMKVCRERTANTCDDARREPAAERCLVRHERPKNACD